MQRKAVIAIGVSICLITAGVGGYLLYNAATDDSSGHLSNTSRDNATEKNPADVQPDIPADDSNDTAVIADSMTEAPREGTESTDPEPGTANPRDDQQADDSSARTVPNRNHDDIDHKTRQRAADAIERILSRARSHRPDSDRRCNKTTTPAVHRASGVRYNFTYDCLPRGWVKVSERHGPNRRDD